MSKVAQFHENYIKVPIKLTMQPFSVRNTLRPTQANKTLLAKSQEHIVR